MDDPERLVFAIILVTIIILVILGAMAMLMVVNANRRVQYKAKLAEEEQRLEREVMRAEREAVHQTLQSVGSELHENIGQLMTVALMGVRHEAELKGRSPVLEGTEEALVRSIAEVRALSKNLNSELWKKRTLAEAIETEVQRMERVLRVRARLEVVGELPVLEPDTSVILYRVFQEAVTNSIKHSSGDIRITLQGDPFVMTVSDNGRGFDPTTVKESNGMANIRRRCGLIGFTAECTSAPGQGCTWRFAQERLSTTKQA